MERRFYVCPGMFKPYAVNDRETDMRLLDEYFDYQLALNKANELNKLDSEGVLGAQQPYFSAQSEQRTGTTKLFLAWSNPNIVRRDLVN